MRELVQLTSDDDVFESARDGAVAVLVKDGLVAGMQPQHAGRVPDHDLVGLFRVVPVSRLQLVSGHAKLAPRANGHNVAVAVDNLGLRVRHQSPHGGEPPRHGVVGKGIKARGGRLGEAVAARKLRHAEAVHQQLHEIARDGGAGDDARAQPVALEVGRGLGLEEGVEHGGDAVDGGAVLVGDGPEGGRDVKDLCRIHDLAAVGDDGQEAEDEAKAVE